MLSAMDWSERFALNSNSIQSTTIHHTDTNLNTKTKKHALPVSSSYQIVFDSINGIPVPAVVLQKASKINSKVGCKLSISLFDLESSSFVGKTWHSPFAIPVIKPVDTAISSSESDDEDSKSPNAAQIDMLRGYLVGNKLNVKLRNQCVYFHTQLQTKHIVAVLEVSFQVTGIHITKIPECYSGGWTIMYLFNPQRGGLTLGEGEEERIEDSKTIPLFGGSPRILPFIAPALFEAAAGFPGMHPLPGSSIQYYILARPDIKKKNLVWKENCFVGPGDDVPGIFKLNLKGIQLNRTDNFMLSQIRIKASPSLDLFEEKMLETVRNHYYEEHPEEISMDSDGRLSMPQILEARMHVGFHNSFNFVQPPIIINLLRNSQDENVDNSLEFLGNIKLEYLYGDGIELVFGVEYKVLISVRGVKEEKGGFTKLVERLSTPTRMNNDYEISGVEKFVTVGWNHCPLNNIGVLQKITLDSGSKPNPFCSLVYRAHTESYRNEREKSEIDPDSASVFACKPLPLELEYLIQEENSINLPSPAISLPAVAEKVTETTIIEPPPRMPTPVKKVTIEEEPPEIEDVTEILISKNEEFSPLPALPPLALKSVLSRIERSRLFHAGFEKIYDENGKLPTVVETSSFNETARCNIDVELKDQRDNELTIQFMAVKFTDDFKNKMAGDLPKSVSFSFQFYTFPNISTERLNIYTGSLPPTQKASQHSRSSTAPIPSLSVLEHSNTLKNNPETESWPGIFYRIEQDGRPAFDRAAGLSIQFNIDRQTRKSCSNVRYGATSFPFYLDDKQLYLDMWDGDSLLYLGTACVDLKCAIRQGKDGVCCENDVDIMWNEYANDDIGHLRRSSSNSSRTTRPIASSSDKRVNSTKIGSLHLKLTNIGRSVSKEGILTTQTAIGSDRVIVPDFHEEVKFRISKVVESKKLADIDMELKQILQSAYQERMEMKKATLNSTDPTQPLTEEGKKLQKVYRAMKRDNVEPPVSWNISDYMNTGPESFAYKQSRQERQKDLDIVGIYRERHKKQAIQEALRQQLTSRHIIDTSFGQGYFFEFVFENPYSTDHTFEITWDDEELRIITSEKEWLYHRRSNNITKGVERNLLSQFTEGRAEIFLKPLEKISIPFLFQSYSALISSAHISSGNCAMKVIKDKERNSAKVVNVSFMNIKKTPVAFLDVVINPINFYVDRSLQIFNCENDLVRKTLRYPISNSSLSGPGENGILNIQYSPTNEKFLKCSNPNVVCSVIPFNKDSKYREVSFQYRVGGAPDHSEIFFVFYHDQFCTNVHEIWKVSLHTIFRLDVNCIYGETSSSSLVLRGRTMTRQAKCFVNLPTQINVTYPGPFTIPANSLAEIPLSLRLKGASECYAIANVVDTETRLLLSSWYIIAHLSMPAITKVFEIKLEKGKASNKRIAYTNPYLHPKLFTLKTDSPSLMQFKSNIMDLKGGEKQYIGLKFAPCFNMSQIEILVFLNNEMDKIEECLSISVQYE